MIYILWTVLCWYHLVSPLEVWSHEDTASSFRKETARSQWEQNVLGFRVVKQLDSVNKASTGSHCGCTLSLRFNSHFPGEPGLASVYWSKGGWRKWWWQLDYWSYKPCKAPVKSSPPTNQHPFFYGPDALPVAQPTMSKHWRENITFHGLAYPKLSGGLPTLSLTTNRSWLPWGGLPCLSSALWCQYPNTVAVLQCNMLRWYGRVLWKNDNEWVLSPVHSSWPDSTELISPSWVE